MASARASPSVTRLRFCRPLLGVGIEEVIPAADFGDHDVMPGKRLGVSVDFVRVGQRHVWTIRGAITEFTMGKSQRFGLVRAGVRRAAQPERAGRRFRRASAVQKN